MRLNSATQPSPIEWSTRRRRDYDAAAGELHRPVEHIGARHSTLELWSNASRQTRRRHHFVQPAIRRPGDLAWGAFSDSPPWILTDRNPEWRMSADRRRQLQAQDLPTLYRAPRLPPLRRALTVLRVIGSALLIWAIRERGTPRSKAAISRRIRVAAEKLGPTYIKLAQIIAAGEGVFPAELVTECKRCRDQVPAVDYQQMVRVVERDLGRPMHDLFSSFSATPMAAASIAQVHRATLLDGTPVVVKVQRPGIDELVRRDLKVLSWLAPFLVGRIPVSALANPPALVELFAETIVEELDFHLEGDNMLDVAEIMVKLKQDGFVIPRPHPELVSTRVLVMEELSGFGFDDVVGMKGAGVNTHDVIRTGMIGFLEGAFLHGVFHGDLHGGNLLVLPDGRTGLLDFGITGRLSDTEKQAFMKMMMTATMNDVHRPGECTEGSRRVATRRRRRRGRRRSRPRRSPARPDQDVTRGAGRLNCSESSSHCSATGPECPSR